MPWHLNKSPDGKATVVTDASGKKHSNRPIPLAQAKKQLAALHANVDEREAKSASFIAGQVAFLSKKAELPPTAGFEDRRRHAPPPTPPGPWSPDHSGGNPGDVAGATPAVQASYGNPKGITPEQQAAEKSQALTAAGAVQQGVPAADATGGVSASVPNTRPLVQPTDAKVSPAVAAGNALEQDPAPAQPQQAIAAAVPAAGPKLAHVLAKAAFHRHLKAAGFNPEGTAPLLMSDMEDAEKDRFRQAFTNSIEKQSPLVQAQFGR